MSSTAAFVLMLLSHEILDVRELRNDWPDLPRRVRELSDAPYSETVHLFPITRAAGSEARMLNRDYARRLRLVAELHNNPPHVMAALRVTDEIYEAWDALGDATVDFYHLHIRRKALAKLRRLLGDEDFFAGRMPLPLPVEDGR